MSIEIISLNSGNKLYCSTQTVRTILLSVISLLSEPNTFSPANVDASVMYRRWKESNGVDDEYAKIIKKQVDQSRAEATRDGVEVPLTLEDYIRQNPAKKPDNKYDHMECFDLYEDDYYAVDSDEDEDTDDANNQSPTTTAPSSSSGANKLRSR